MTFTPTPVKKPGKPGVHADGILIPAEDGSVGLYITWAELDWYKALADVERDLQAKFARTGMRVVR